VLIGADGIHSTIATHLFGQRVLRYVGYTIIRGIASFQHPFFSPGKIFQTWGPGGLFGAVKLTQGRVYWYLQLTSPAGSPRREKEELLALCRGWHEPIEALITATEGNTLLQNDVYDSKPLSHWGNGRVTLVGDAAHPLAPALAQGACQAIEDAGMLGFCLRAEPAIQALRAYEHARIKRATMVVRQSRQVGKMDLWDTLTLSWVRDLSR
jgi:2-polyprenyl-6-methoxyphenol hydroxylase-like FAD-dependent oxidoreductase